MVRDRERFYGGAQWDKKIKRTSADIKNFWIHTIHVNYKKKLYIHLKHTEYRRQFVNNNLHKQINSVYIF